MIGKPLLCLNFLTIEKIQVLRKYCSKTVASIVFPNNSAMNGANPLLCLLRYIQKEQKKVYRKPWYPIPSPYFTFCFFTFSFSEQPLSKMCMLTNVKKS